MSYYVFVQKRKTGDKKMEKKLYKGKTKMSSTYIKSIIPMDEISTITIDKHEIELMLGDGTFKRYKEY